MSTKQTVSESFGPSIVGDMQDRVDEANAVVKHVKIVGFTSRNGRDYRKVVTKETAAKYEGRPVFMGHPTNSAKRGSGYGEGEADSNGFVTNPVVEADGIYADHKYNPEHPKTKRYLWDVRHNSHNVGFSHHADITESGARGGGRRVVESIDKVYSVDLVNSPATTNGVFESEGDGPMTKTLKQILEAAETAGDNGLDVLESMMAAGSLAGDLEVEVVESAEGQIKAALKAASAAALQDAKLNAKDAIAKSKAVYEAYEKAIAPPAKKQDEPTVGQPTMESLSAELTTLKRRDEVRDLAAKEGVQLSEVNLKAAVALESADDRKAFVKGLPKLAAKQADVAKPHSSGVMESAGAGGDDQPKSMFESQEKRLSFLRSR